MSDLPDDDPRPLPPVRPDIDECCNSGCHPCIFDLYEEALEGYRRDLLAWEARSALRKTGMSAPPDVKR